MQTRYIAFEKQLLFFFFFVILQVTPYCQRTPKLMVESGVETPVIPNTIIFSRDNRFLALTAENQVKIYDLKTGFLLKKIKRENDYSYISFSSDFNKYAFTRLQVYGEPNDSLSFTAIGQTFADAYLYKTHHTTNDYHHSVRMLNQYLVLYDNDSLRFIDINAPKQDTTFFKTQDWSFDQDEKLILVADENNAFKYNVIRLQDFDTLYKVDFSQKDIAQNAGANDEDFISESASFTSNNRYVMFRAEYLSAPEKNIRIYDCEKGEVIFNRNYPLVDNNKNIFFNPVTFSPVTGALTLPAENGLFIYNAWKTDSFFIPLTKKQVSTTVNISSDGRYIFINDDERISVYNTITGEKIFDEPFSFYDVIINPAFNYVYFSSGILGLKKETLIFDTEKEKIIGKNEGPVVSTSPNGKIVYGKIDLKNYLFNQVLQPLKEINNCTPYAEAIISGNEPAAMLVKNNNFCDIENNGTAPLFDFSAWNIEKLAKYRNDLSAYSYNLGLVRSYSFYNNNLYFTDGLSLHSFTDTFQTEILNKRYGTLEGMQGNYLVFLQNSFANTSDNTLPPAIDTITILRNIKTELTRFIINTSAYIYSAYIDTIKNHVIIFSDDKKNPSNKSITVYNYQGGQLAQYSFYLPSQFDVYSSFIKEVSPDGNYIHFAINKGWTNGTEHLIIDLNTRRIICDITVASGKTLAVNWKEKKYFTSQDYPFPFVHSFNASKLKYRMYPVAANDSLYLGLQPVGDFNANTPDSLIVSLTKAFRIVLMNWQKKDTVYTGGIINDFITVGVISKDNKWLAYANQSFEIILMNLELKKSYTLKGHTDYVLNLCFNGNELISSSEDGTNKLWSLDSMKEIVSFVNLRDNDYVISSPDGYYTSTKKAQSQFSFVSGNTAIAPQQLDLFYNRPDILLRKTGCADSVLIHSYYTAWQKRLRRSGFANENINKIFNAPSLEILNLDSIELITEKPSMILNIKAADSTTGLKSFNIWIDECPLFGAKGINISSRNSNHFDTSIIIFLSDSINVIETAVTNSYGVESYRRPLYIKYANPHPAKPATWFIGIGVNDYVQQDKHLNYAAKDIQDLSDLFQSACKKEHTEFHSILLLNQQAVKQNILATKDSLMQTHINDKIIFAFSGHGLQSDSLDFYLATADVDFNKPEEKGVLYQDFEDVFDGIPARNKLMLIDACHSGETDKEEVPAVAASIGTQLQNLKAAITKKNLGLQNSFELMQQLFADVSKSNGATVISAARGSQFANEGDEWNNGAFTYCIKEGLLQNKADANNDGKITINELKDYVSNEVERITEGSQQPTARKELIANDWVIW